MNIERGEVFLFGSNTYGQLGIDSDDDDDGNALPDMLNSLNWDLLFENEAQENETNVIIDGTNPTFEVSF
jgi:alpha-tubulin suppressor-like RCC1 family protein